jgi:hypothetical protein
METIDTQNLKILKMHEYIAKCRAQLSETDDAELAKRNRQYWSASTNRQKYLEKLSELKEKTQKALNKSKKTKSVIFIAAIFTVLAIQYFNLVEKNTQIILGFAFAALLVIKEFAIELEANKNALKQDGWRQQVDFYLHEMKCCGGGYVEYENEYLKSQNSNDVDSKKVIRELFLLSVEIAILHGLKSKMQDVEF